MVSGVLAQDMQTEKLTAHCHCLATHGACALVPIAFTARVEIHSLSKHPPVQRSAALGSPTCCPCWFVKWLHRLLPFKVLHPGQQSRGAQALIRPTWTELCSASRARISATAWGVCAAPMRPALPGPAFANMAGLSTAPAQQRQHRNIQTSATTLGKLLQHNQASLLLSQHTTFCRQAKYSSSVTLPCRSPSTSDQKKK